MEKGENMDLWEICRAKKESLNLTMQEIADNADLPVGTVKKFFSAASKSPSVYTVAPICRVLGISLDEVFDISDRLTPTEETLSARQEQLEHRVESKDKTIDILLHGIHVRNHVMLFMGLLVAILLVWAVSIDLSCGDIGIFRG